MYARLTARASCWSISPGMINRREFLGLRGAMTTLPLGRRFVLAHATLLALFNLSVLLPGNPVSSNREFIVAVGVQALVVWRLWHGSSLSWLLAMLFAAGYIVTIVLIQPTLEVGIILTFVLSVAQVLILWMYALTRERPLPGSVGIPSEPLRQ
jgi:hypothetical protein